MWVDDQPYNGNRRAYDQGSEKAHNSDKIRIWTLGFFSLTSSSMLFQIYRYQNSAAKYYFTSGPLKKCWQYNLVVTGSQNSTF